MSRIYGTAGDETMLGTNSDDVFEASAGDDRIWGGMDGTDQLRLTGSWNDYEISDNGDGSYTIRDLRDGSPDGTDVIRSIEALVFTDMEASLTDYLADRENYNFGTKENDTQLGSKGDDVFVASAGDDRLWGGTDGVDAVHYSGGIEDYEFVDNGNGSYTIRDLRSGSPDGTDVLRGIETFVFADTTTTLDGMLATSTVEQVGTSGNDQILGTAGDDVLQGAGGDDRIWGGTDGEDVAVYSGNLSDYAIWNRGDGSYIVKDVRSGSPDGEDIVREIEVFSFADQRVTLSEFVDAYVEPEFKIINGSAEDDVIIGTQGDDIFHAFGGNDRVWGGQGGFDKLVLTGQLSDYVITDNETGGAYTFVDTREGSPDGTKVVRDIESIEFADQEVAWQELLLVQSSDTVTEDYVGTAAAEEMSGAHTDNLFDAHSNDTLIGNAQTDWLRGGPGDDVLYGDDISSTTATAPIRTSFPTTNLAPFDFEEGLYQVINGQLNKLDVATGEYSPIGKDQDNYNAIGLNEADGYAYGIGSRNTEFAGYLLRVGADGGVEPLIGGLPSVAAGTFGDDGRLYIRTAANELMAVNVESLESERIHFSGDKPSAVHDLVFVDDAEGGQFYGLSKYGQLVTYDLEDRTVSQVTVSNLEEIGPFGAGWTAADGGLYFSDNSTGNIYGISGIEKGQPSASLLAVGSTSRINDGFSYGSAPLPEFLRADGTDYLLGGSGSDQLYGGVGDDFLDGGDGADLLLGGDGVDTADYTRATSAVEADLTLGGQKGEAAGDTYESIERLEGSFFDDVLIGDEAANVLRGRDGDDIIQGGLGDDILRGDSGADQLDGGDGFDTATYFDMETGVSVDLGAGTSSDGDVLTAIEAVQGSNVGDDELFGSASVDHLFGFGGDDVLSGRGSSDIIHGGDGADTIDGGDHADFLLGQGGNDAVHGGAGDDNVQGGAGDDTLSGDDGNDRVFGADGNDVLSGGLGDDHLRGGIGEDTLMGGQGADTFHFSAASGRDVVSDFEVGTDKIDLSDLGEIESVADLQFAASGNGTLITSSAVKNEFEIDLIGVDPVQTGSIDFIF